jgi:hypothetical protein
VNLRDKVKIYKTQLASWPQFTELLNNINEAIGLSSEVAEKSLMDEVAFSRVPDSMRSIILLDNCVELIKIPPVRPIRVDMVDSGLGQAPRQKDVQLCDRILFRLLETNCYARVSLADHDSYMNYAERTNSAISDAMCIGSSISCDVYNLLNNLRKDFKNNVIIGTFRYKWSGILVPGPFFK